MSHPAVILAEDAAALPKKLAGVQIVDVKLDRNWADGYASPAVNLPSNLNAFIARGQMRGIFPHLRLAEFRAQALRIHRVDRGRSVDELHIDPERCRVMGRLRSPIDATRGRCRRPPHELERSVALARQSAWQMPDDSPASADDMSYPGAFALSSGARARRVSDSGARFVIPPDLACH